MSFLGGAECSTAGNPLSQFTKHVQDDRSLQRDRLVGNAPNASLNGFRSAGRGMVQDDNVNRFLQQGPALPDLSMDPGHNPMGNQLAIDPSRSMSLRARSTSPTWSDGVRSQTPMKSGFSPEEFAKFQQHQQQQQHYHQQQSQPPMASSSAAAATLNSGMSQMQSPMMGMGMNMGMGTGMGMGMGMGMGYDMPMMYRQPVQSNWPQQQFQSPPLAQQQFGGEGQTYEGKGKGRVVELNDTEWEEQFARMEMQDKQADAAAVDGSTTTAAAAAEEKAAQDALERELNHMDERILEPETGFGDLEAVWKGIQAENAALRDSFDGDWDVTDSMDRWVGNGLDGDEYEPLSYRTGVDPHVEEYRFEEENLFKEQNNPFEEGLRIMEENGNLSLAALAFEAACKREPERVEAWVYLGLAQAQNEKETAAIRALEQALKLDPTNLAALMAVAVSYTNEGYDTTAYRTLERWLSAKYPHVLPPAELSSPADMGFTDRQQLHERVTSRFIQAAQLSPDGEHMDPDVQVGLGVLFYGGEEFDKAVDCFHAALASSETGSSNQRSQLHLLWNRLGATLANSGRSEEAIAAYEKALALHPNFVRARYNLGVSCINMGCYDEAASHLLASLAMHKEVEKSGRERARELLGGAGAGVTDDHLDRMTTQNRSATLYDTLRRVFGLMDRRDLADRVSIDMDPDSFRGEFDF